MGRDRWLWGIDSLLPGDRERPVRPVSAGIGPHAPLRHASSQLVSWADCLPILLGRWWVGVCVSLSSTPLAGPSVVRALSGWRAVVDPRHRVTPTDRQSARQTHCPTISLVSSRRASQRHSARSASLGRAFPGGLAVVDQPLVATQTDARTASRTVRTTISLGCERRAANHDRVGGSRASLHAPAPLVLDRVFDELERCRPRPDATELCVDVSPPA